MTSEVNIRAVRAEDSAALMALDEQTPDTGLIGFYAEYHYDYLEVQKALRPNFAGFVAEASGRAGLVGSSMMSLGMCNVDGDLRPYAYLSGLGVHPDYRRRGIALALTQALIARAREQFGEDGVIFAGIQGGNEGSLAASTKWATQRISGRNAVTLGMMRTRLAKPVDGLTVRPATGDDLAQIAAAQNEFYQDTNFYPPKSAEQLASWLGERPFGHDINGYYVVQDRQGKLAAGVGVNREGMLLTSHLVRMPWFLRVANLVLGMFPRNGVSKRLNPHWFWYAPGEERAGAYLWEEVRWLERSHATVAMMFFDPQGPVSRAVTRPRFGPPSDGHLVVKAPFPVTADRSVYFNNILV